MPRLNYGTLLENLVVTEVARACLRATDSSSSVVFASSFAMPPLTQCWAKRTDGRNSPGFGEVFVRGLRGQQRAVTTSLRDMWGRCVINKPRLPVSRLRDTQLEYVAYEYEGPNGALLVAMLANAEGRELHQWINDDGGRYGEVPPTQPSSASEVPRTMEHAASLNEKPAIGSATYVPGRFPNTVSELQRWLTAEPAARACVRVGFLDPDNYVEGDASVSQDGHQRWLCALASECDHAVSVLFMMCQNRGTANQERDHKLRQFDGDEKSLFSRSIVFEHGNFQTGVKVRWPADTVEEFVSELSRRVQKGWSQWREGMKGLTVHVDGRPGT
ncbi:MAG TPA: hypothetical protein VE153_12675 [Myxococcus sp.]|nr:hypothetical protein [Myxococcus sp.]